VNCLNCGTENNEGAKFCNECGNPLAISCPNCGHQNQPGSKFCSECGTRLQEIPAPPPAVSQAPASPDTLVQSLIPEEFAVKLEGARSARAMVGERRTVTMLFCDVKGSTIAAEQLDPEDWAEIMNGAFEYMIRPVYKYEGMVARLMGDAVLAFFGAPIAHEDDPQRAILAGLEILDRFEAYRDQVVRDWRLEINARVGINTGLVMVGVIGSDLRMEYTAMGDAINLASRMEQTAEPGTVQVAEDTYRLAGPVFEWEDLGEIEVKGKTEPIHTFRPLRGKAQPGSLRGIEGLDSPLVGRDKELEKLKAAADQLEKGIGGIVFIEGEAGLGKSRLMEEFHGYMQKEGKAPVAWQGTASLSYETAQPYALFQRLLRRKWEIPPNASPDMVRSRIAQEFEEHLEEEKSQLQKAFEILMGVGETGGSQLEGEMFKRELFSGVTALWGPDQPVVIACDDLHWADPASTELLAHLFARTERAALLVICVMRPDRSTPGWQIKETAERDYPHRYTEISLPPLTNEDTNELVDNLLTIANLPAGLRQNILAKTDGNPFFVEEVVRTLIDSGAIVREKDGEVTRWRAIGNIEALEIPGNLQSLLTARIDRLEEDARLTLQLASVIGRTFFYRVLESINQAVAVIHSELDQQLLTLQRVELIQEAARVPELEYMFRHSLTQEAAYNTILLRQRGGFHSQVGEAIEEQFADRLEEFYPMLAYHFREAGDARALKYAILSGDAAFQLFAISEALEYYGRALEFTKSLEETPESLTQVYLRYGRCLELQSDYQAAQQNYEKMADLAREGDDQNMLLEALLAGAIACAIPSPAQQTEKGQYLADQSLALARELGNLEAEAKTLWVFVLLNIYGGQVPTAVPFGERSVELARELGMSSQLAYSLQDLGLAYISLGDLDKANAALAEARPLWKTLGNLPMLAENWANTCYMRVDAAQFDEAIAASEESLRIAVSIDNEWGRVNSQGFVGLVYLARGEIDLTLQTINGFITDAERIGHPGHIVAYGYLALLYSRLGAHDLALETALHGVEVSIRFPPFRPICLAMLVKQKVRLGEFAEAQTLLGEVGKTGSLLSLQLNDHAVYMETIEYHLSLGEFSQAHTVIELLLSKMKASRSRYFLPDALYLKAKYLHELGDTDAARKVLQEARSAAEEIDSRIILWRILADFGEVKAAREIVEFIAGNISDAGLHETFQNYSKSVIERSVNIDRIGK
jgi:class 3 adenylate cyclase/tetratricopeptide (TPR) repeat protein